MPSKRGDAPSGASIPTQASSSTGSTTCHLAASCTSCLDLSWKAKVAEDWTQWWDWQGYASQKLCRPYSFDRKASRSRSASTSVTTPTNRSFTPRRDTRRSATRTRTARAGKGPLGHLAQETFQEVEELREYELDSFESQHEPNSQADMRPRSGHAMGVHLDVAELVELARRKRRETIIAYPPIPPEVRDPEATLLHNVRWWLFPCGQGGMPPLSL